MYLYGNYLHDLILYRREGGGRERGYRRTREIIDISYFSFQRNRCVSITGNRSTMENIMRALSIFNLSRAIEGANRVTRTLVFRDRDANLCSAKLGKNAREKLLLFSGRTEGGGASTIKICPPISFHKSVQWLGNYEVKFVEPNETKRRERDRERNYITREETRDKVYEILKKNCGFVRINEAPFTIVKTSDQHSTIVSLFIN